RNVPLRVYTSIPSCVPATSPKFETTGGNIDVEDVREALQWDRTVALGEVMDYPSVLRGEEEIHAMIRETLGSGKVVEGHAPDLSEEELNAYIGTGVSSCHESTRKEEGLEKLRLGMCLMIREGFASIKNLSELIRVVTEENVDTSRICLVTDDRHPEDIINEGHMDHVVRRAIEEGVDPIEAIQMSTINTATHFKVDQVVGGIAPGRFADMVILEDLDMISVSEVIADGRIVASNGEFIGKFGSYKYPEDAKRSVKLSRKLDRHDFTVQAEQKRDTAKVRVMGVDESSPITENLTEELPIDDGSLQTSVDRDLAKVAVVERHKKTGNIGLGFVTGFGFEEGATATTIAHDSHNLLIVGMDEGDMAVAANKLAEVGGGVVTVREGEILRFLKLPIGGLMSDQPLERTREKMSKLSKSWDELGCKMDFPFPTIVLLALPVLPKLRITDKGLVDTVSFEKIDLLID
ncbi:adenosine deaminase, partial [candidate division MSBL1 archaeon SCGC-AAA259B11]